MARRCWLVRAGERPGTARLLESSGTVVLGVDDRGLGDLTGLDVATVQEHLEAAPGRPDRTHEAAWLVGFRDHVRPGDVVVTVDVPSHQLLVGEVIGDYEYQDGPTGGHHVRAVEWYGRYGADDRGIMSPSMAAATQLPQALLELTPPNAWMSFVAAMRERPPLAAAPPRPPVTSAASTRASAGRSPAAPRAPRAPRVKKPAAPTRPKPVEQVYRRCPQCQMQKIPAQFRPGSEHCVDCRELMGED